MKDFEGLFEFENEDEMTIHNLKNENKKYRKRNQDLNNRLTRATTERDTAQKELEKIMARLVGGWFD